MGTKCPSPQAAGSGAEPCSCSWTGCVPVGGQDAGPRTPCKSEPVVALSPSGLRSPNGLGEKKEGGCWVSPMMWERRPWPWELRARGCCTAASQLPSAQPPGGQEDQGWRPGKTAEGSSAPAGAHCTAGLTGHVQAQRSASEPLARPPPCTPHLPPAPHTGIRRGGRSLPSSSSFFFITWACSRHSCRTRRSLQRDAASVAGRRAGKLTSISTVRCKASHESPLLPSSPSVQRADIDLTRTWGRARPAKALWAGGEAGAPRPPSGKASGGQALGGFIHNGPPTAEGQGSWAGSVGDSRPAANPGPGTRDGVAVGTPE